MVRRKRVRVVQLVRRERTLRVKKLRIKVMEKSRIRSIKRNQTTKKMNP